MKKSKIKNSIIAFSLVGMMTLGGRASEAALGDRTLSQGMRHNDVKELQQGLRKLNFFNHREDTTYFGNITRQAVINFQRANGLAADGYFGPASVKVLKNNLNGAKPPAPPKSNGNRTLTYNRVLRNGSKGNDVRALQQTLANLGYYKSTIDSSFGNGTRTAVINFQRAQRIAADGIVGSGTIRALNNVLTGKPNTTPSRGNSGKSTSINIINTSKKYIGSKYVFGGSSPSGFDCSGFTQYVYKQNGINIPRATTSQANVGTRLSKSQLQPGDLLIFSNTYKAGPSHAGVYIGNGQFVHSGNPSTGVRVDSINSRYYNEKFSYGRKVF